MEEAAKDRLQDWSHTEDSDEEENHELNHLHGYITLFPSNSSCLGMGW